MHLYYKHIVLLSSLDVRTEVDGWMWYMLGVCQMFLDGQLRAFHFSSLQPDCK